MQDSRPVNEPDTLCTLSDMLGICGRWGFQAPGYE